jgi:preprotein translocase subunit Sec61beta
MVNKGENNPAKAGFIDFFEKTTCSYFTTKLRSIPHQ